jgi:uncharacterized protein HemX
LYSPGATTIVLSFILLGAVVTLSEGLVVTLFAQQQEREKQKERETQQQENQGEGEHDGAHRLEGAVDPHGFRKQTLPRQADTVLIT